MEFTRAKKVTKQSSDEEIRRRLLNWPDAYYREREPEIRFRMLEEAENQGLTPEDNVIRRELYEIRYPSKGNIKDKYLSAWMNMRFMTERNNGVIFRRHDPKKVRDVLGEIGIGVRMDDRRYQQLLYQEIYHLGMLYGALCCEDKQYGSIIFGFGSMSEEKLAFKIARDFKEVGIEIPENYQAGPDYEVWGKALTAAFCDQFPDYAYLLEGSGEE